MAESAMKIFLAHPEDQLLGSSAPSGPEPLRPKLFEVASTQDQSMLACVREGPLVVISASGMLSGGRILHHLKRRLPDARNTVMFTGYQAQGTKGRFLQELRLGPAAREVFRIHHQPVEVAAEVVTLDHLSSHADQRDLLKWLGAAPRKPQAVILNHGEDASKIALAACLRRELGIRVLLSAPEEAFDLRSLVARPA
jgi:metallo-beta-lactamase family protein